MHLKGVFRNADDIAAVVIFITGLNALLVLIGNGIAKRGAALTIGFRYIIGIGLAGGGVNQKVFKRPQGRPFHPFLNNQFGICLDCSRRDLNLLQLNRLCLFPVGITRIAVQGIGNRGVDTLPFRSVHPGLGHRNRAPVHILPEVIGQQTAGGDFRVQNIRRFIIHGFPQGVNVPSAFRVKLWQLIAALLRFHQIPLGHRVSNVRLRHFAVGECVGVLRFVQERGIDQGDGFIGNHFRNFLIRLSLKLHLSQ